MRTRPNPSRTTRLRYVGVVGLSNGDARLYAQQEHLYGPAGWRAVGQPLALMLPREILSSQGWYDVIASAAESAQGPLAPAAAEPQDLPLPGL